MKKTSLLFVLLAAIVLMVSCDKKDTYADQLDRERNAINAYVVKEGIKVISEEQFNAQNHTTNVSKNEYVLLANSGVYMQIVDLGVGKKIKKGETATVLCRFDERNLLTDSLQLTNNALYWSGMVDKMMVTNTSGTFTASFDQGSSVMFKANQSTIVPEGWLAPLRYINIGRPKTATEKIAKVRLIVPSSKGSEQSKNRVTPCFYEITYQRGI